MIVVGMQPFFGKPDRGDGGIRRVVEAMVRHGPDCGFQITNSTEECDLIAVHGTAYAFREGIPTVHHSHGLYWSRHNWAGWGHEANRQVMESMIRSVAHSAPSEWVARALRRGGLFYPEVIYHGVDPDQWKPPVDAKNQDYVLWNKARADAVSDPDDMQRLAALLPTTPFRTTIGQTKPNVQVIGVMPVENMMPWVQHAGVYLATARETFGIGTLEAMSCGVPIVGWDWGGQSEIIRHGETGFLAKPGDYAALAEGVRWALANRAVLGMNARQDVVERWTWPQRIEQYAEFYRTALFEWNAPRAKVSVITTVHNRTMYLQEAVKSVQAQTMGDWEHLIVDDGSTDETRSLVKELAKKHDKVRSIRTPSNLKLSGARNYGFDHAYGRYILFLDDDDQLEPHALELLSDALDKDPGIHIAYGHLDTVNERGEDRKRNDWPWERYMWWAQMAHLNQLPYSAMMRREVIERSGGYRRRAWRAEDAEHWCRATSLGFRARKVTERSTLIYRMHLDQKSRGERGDGDWTAWFPWRIGASSPQEGLGLLKRGQTLTRPDLVPWSAQASPPENMRFWRVEDHHDPKISVVIPVGPGHEPYVIDALDSLMAQTYPYWEAIVVNATGKEWDEGRRSPVAGAPYAKLIVPVDGNRLRPAEARNLGAKHARSESILFLDADDMLLPRALEEMIRLHLGTEGGLVYTDWLRSDGDPEIPLKLYESWDFHCGDVLVKMRHAVTCLVPRWAHEKIGGFDESFEGWEDWDYFIALQAEGVCSYRLNQPGFVYRFRHGTIREQSYGVREKILERIRSKWADYYEGRKTMGCGKCPKGRRAALSSDSDPQIASVPAGTGEPVLLEYQGPGSGKVSIRGPETGVVYIFQGGQRKYVHAADASVFLKQSRKGIPDFLLVGGQIAAPTNGAAPVQAQTVVDGAEVSGPPERPDFPEMVVEEEPVPDISAMTVSQIHSAIVDAGDGVLLQWLRDERAGKNRVTAIQAIEDALAPDSEAELESEPT